MFCARRWRALLFRTLTFLKYNFSVFAILLFTIIWVIYIYLGFPIGYDFVLINN